MPGDAPVLILTGPPGAGKTTVAARLAARFPRAVHLEADHFSAASAAGYVEPWRSESNEQNRAVMGVVADAAAGYLALLDGIVTPSWFLKPVRGALRHAGRWSGFADCGEFEANAIDPGDESPDEVVDLLARRLEEGLLAA